MDFWKNATDSVTKAVDFIVDKNRKAAMMNRLKIVIRNEKEAQAHAYIQLGKYYYHHLRDKEDGDTETYCKAVDVAGQRLRRAYTKLDEITSAEKAEKKENEASPSSSDAENDGMADETSSDEPAEETEEETETERVQPVPFSNDAKSSGAPGQNSYEEPGQNSYEEPAEQPEGPQNNNPPSPYQEAVDDEEDYLHPFSFMANHGTGTEEKPDGSEPDENATDDSKPRNT